MGPWDGWHMGSGWGWVGMLVGVILMLIFWGSIIILVFFAIRWFARSGGNDQPGDVSRRKAQSALEILEERYARGEIMREEYLEMKRDLET